MFSLPHNLDTYTTVFTLYFWYIVPVWGESLSVWRFLRRPKGRRSNIALALNYSPIRSIFKL